MDLPNLLVAGLLCLTGAGCYLSHDVLVPQDAGVTTDAPAEPSDCVPEDLSTWADEHLNAGGNYDRAVASLSGTSWLALKEHDANLLMTEVAIEDAGIVLGDREEILDPSAYPIAFDTDGTRFVVVTSSGINWNGAITVWSVNRATGETSSIDWTMLGAEPNYTARASIGLVGDNVVTAGVRADSNVAVIELRNARLEILQSVEREETYGTLAVRTDDRRIELYLGRFKYVVEPESITPDGVGLDHEVIGGLDEFLVEYDDDFRIRRGDELWSGPWPHTQISPPAVLRHDGERPAFSLQMELSGTVGYTVGDRLEWLTVTGTLEASGIGVALLPVIDPRRLGFFYLGLEIPRPEQPLRYFGKLCR